MSNIPAFPYKDLWNEKTVTSVANLTRADRVEFLQLAGDIPIITHTQCYALHEANQALDDIRSGTVLGSAVLKLFD